MKKLIIYGTGLIAEVAEFYFRTDSDYEVVAFTNAARFIDRETFQGKPLAAFEDVEHLYSPAEFAVFIALGYAKTNKIRQARYNEAKGKGYTCVTYVSSRAAYYGTPVGDNCFILENNVIQPMVSIGSDVTLWSGNPSDTIRRSETTASSVPMWSCPAGATSAKTVFLASIRRCGTTSNWGASLLSRPELLS